MSVISILILRINLFCYFVNRFQLSKSIIHSLSYFKCFLCKWVPWFIKAWTYSFLLLFLLQIFYGVLYSFLHFCCALILELFIIYFFCPLWQVNVGCLSKLVSSNWRYYLCLSRKSFYLAFKGSVGNAVLAVRMRRNIITSYARFVASIIQLNFKQISVLRLAT